MDGFVLLGGGKAPTVLSVFFKAELPFKKRQGQILVDVGNQGRGEGEGEEYTKLG